jgi:integrase
MPRIHFRKPKIRKRKNKSTQSFEVDCGLINGKRFRRSFPSRRDAERYAVRVQESLRREGERAFQLPEEDRIDAVAACEIVKPFSATLADAARYYREHYLRFKESPSLNDLIAEYVQVSIRNNRRARTVSDLSNRLRVFSETFGLSKPCDVESSDIEGWIHEHEEWSPRTKINYLTKVSQLFNYAFRKRWVRENPVEFIAKPSSQQLEVEIFNPEEARQLLNCADEFELLPYISLGLFAGLRSAEIFRLDWNCVLLEHDCIRIGAETAKKRSQRTVTIQPILREWLIRCSSMIGGVVDEKHFRERMRRCREKSGILAWKNNGLRHSYGSYHLAKFGNEILTAKEMGHRDPGLVHNHYKALVLPKHADEYWSILPKKPN